VLQLREHSDQDAACNASLKGLVGILEKNESMFGEVEDMETFPRRLLRSPPRVEYYLDFVTSVKVRQSPFIELEINLLGARIIQVSHAFTEMFGYTKETIESSLKWSGGAFFPWGIDLLALLIPSESEVFGFMQLLAIKFEALKLSVQESTPPIIPRETLAGLACEVQVARPSFVSEGQQPVTISCMIKSAYRESLHESSLNVASVYEFRPFFRTICSFHRN
jgi:hypothetical protein